MFLYSLLEVSEKTTDVVKWISILAVLVVFGVLAALSLCRKKQVDTKRLAFAGVCVSLSFTLAVIKFKPVASGGSVTLASFVPVMLYAYAYGALDGLLVGLVHGLLNFVESPYILTPVTFIFDYLLAFLSIGAMGLFGKMKRRQKGCLPLVLGSLTVFSLRFLSHFFSGMIFFMQDAVWVSLPAWATANAAIYSFIYQCVYIPADCLIATLTLVALCKTGVLDALLKMMKGNKSER